MVVISFELPPLAGLSAAQRRGTLCVWCGAGLPAGTAHSLPPHPTETDGVLMFPRSCSRCWRSRS